MRVLDLFSGIGGFSLGLERAGMATVAFCEIEPYRREVLRRHWPGVPIYGDVREIGRERLAADGIVADLVCGGFPCQDLSVAGKGAGIEGVRSGLWTELARVIGEVRPQYALLENVANLLAGPSDRRGGWFSRILGDLAALGYDAEWHCIPASHLGAPIERDRVWILAQPDARDGATRVGFGPSLQREVPRARDRNGSSIWLASTRPPPGMGDGLSDRLDRRVRTEAIGDAVVPQVVEVIGRAIMAADGAAAELREAG